MLNSNKRVARSSDMTCRDILYGFLEDCLRAWLQLAGRLLIYHSRKSGLFCSSGRPKSSGWTGGCPEIVHQVGAKSDRCQAREETETGGKGKPPANATGVGALAFAGCWHTSPGFSRQRLQAL